MAALLSSEEVPELKDFTSSSDDEELLEVEANPKSFAARIASRILAPVALVAVAGTAVYAGHYANKLNPEPHKRITHGYSLMKSTVQLDEECKFSAWPVSCQPEASCHLVLGTGCLKIGGSADTAQAEEKKKEQVDEVGECKWSWNPMECLPADIRG
eukprot:TRINITY_DN42376_c0_g1_i2.p1 TRINITY_DN42376_c0_g1~~TRINITY_DN42376_c0_g1_i2.p1  ORF type:complete len:157 (+),score=45.14 TRINITY_DN42376_c0_g1_i2:77-547(+)